MRKRIVSIVSVSGTIDAPEVDEELSQHEVDESDLEMFIAILYKTIKAREAILVDGVFHRYKAAGSTSETHGTRANSLPPEFRKAQQDFDDTIQRSRRKPIDIKKYARVAANVMRDMRSLFEEMAPKEDSSPFKWPQ